MNDYNIELNFLNLLLNHIRSGETNRKINKKRENEFIANLSYNLFMEKRNNIRNAFIETDGETDGSRRANTMYENFLKYRKLNSNIDDSAEICLVCIDNKTDIDKKNYSGILLTDREFMDF